MWNDLRDLKEDAAHPAALARHRLPSDLDPIGAAFAILANLFRLLLGLAVTWLYLPSLDSVIFIATALTFGIAIVYESAKRWNRGVVSRKNDKMNLTLGAICIYGFVGGGYAVRIALGLWIGSGGQLPATGYLMAIIELWLVGAMFTMMTWVIDSCGFLEQGTPE